MNSRFLLIGLGYLIVCFFDSFKIRIVISVLLTILIRYLFDQKFALIYQIMLILLLAFSLPIQAEYFGKGHVCSIRDNYCIVNNHLYSVIVYGLEDVSLDDEIIINSEVRPIHSYSNFTFTTYESYCKGNNIIGSINNSHFKVIRKTNSLRQYLYNNNLKNNLWANTILFNNGIELENENAYLIIATGMQMSFLVYFIRSILEKVLYPKTTLITTILIAFLLNILFHFPFGLIRVLVSLIIEYLIKDRRDKVGIYIIVLCLIKPYYVKSISFLIPVGIRILNLFKKEGYNWCITLYIITIQLLFNGYCNVIETFFFSFMRLINGFLYVLAFFISFVNIPIRLDNIISQYLNIIDKMNFLKFTGRVGIVFVLLVIYLLFKVFYSGKKRYVLLVIIILLINNFKSLVNPFYSITFLDVGQGDCAVIQTPFSSKTLLIDVCGNLYKDISKDIIVKYLLDNSLAKTDVIISHDDYDHNGGLDSLIKLFAVDEIYTQKKEEIIFNDIKIINPLSDKTYEDNNDNSLISYFSIGNYNFLFTGDASSIVENDLIKRYPNLAIDVFKLAHHGSKTANSDNFFRHYNILLGIISVGYNNRYSHPNSEVIDRLNKYEIDYLTTKDNGAIKLYIFRNFMIYLTSRGQFGFVTK